jgi:hypothetical protein
MKTRRDNLLTAAICKVNVNDVRMFRHIVMKDAQEIDARLKKQKKQEAPWGMRHAHH